MTFILRLVLLLFSLLLISDQHVIGQNAKSQELLHLQQKINAARQLLQNVTNQLSFKQTQAAEEATSIPSASQHPLTEQLTTEQSVTSEVPTPKGKS